MSDEPNDTAAEPFNRVEAMAAIECARLFLWWYFLQAKQLHLAHHSVLTGFRAVEALRSLPQNFQALTYGQRERYGRRLTPWIAHLTDTRTFMLTHNSGRDWVRRIESLHLEATTLHVLLITKPTPAELSRIEPGSCLAPKEEPCENARAQDAERPSPAGCSPASDTGPPCRQGSSRQFGTATMNAGRTVADSLGLPKPSKTSSGKRSKKGSGRKKARRPYEKAAAKKLP